MQWRENGDPRTLVVLVGWLNTTTWSTTKKEKLQLSDIGGKKLEINRDKKFLVVVFALWLEVIGCQ